MSTVVVSNLGRFGPFLVVAPFQAIIFAFYAKVFLPIGFLGILGGALVGVLWALVVGIGARRLMRREAWRMGLANGLLFAGITAIGLTIGGGYMYAAMMSRALDVPSLTGTVLSALMQPAVPFFIALNSVLELFLIALIVFWNWDSAPGRRGLIVVAALAYLVMRIWTYLVFAETRLDLSQRFLSDADITWFRSTLATDFRIVLNIITFGCLLFAAFLPARPQRAYALPDHQAPTARGLAAQS